MTTSAKLAGFAAVLAAALGIAALAGSLIGPAPSEDEAAAETHGGGGMEEEHAAPDPVRGLAVAENGLRLVVDTPELRRNEPATLRFRVVGAHGETVRDFDVEHEKRMHLIVARRDLTGFQHLHPRQASDGSWSTDVQLPDAGSYRVFADFAHDGEKTTLASDLRVDGAAHLQPVPEPAPTAVSDGGYDVRLDGGAPRPGEEADLAFTITKDGEEITPEPYLGAAGHLVALREGDLAFLHVHPEEGDRARFMATFPTTGRYRLFLQFKHEGRVQTVAFSTDVA